LNYTGSVNNLIWEKLSSPTIPLMQRADSGVAAIGRYAYIFGGMNPDFTLPTNFVALDFYTNRYVVVDSSPPLPARYGHAMVSVPSMNAFLIFGGSFADGSSANDLWIFQQQSGKMTGKWTQLMPATQPPSRMWFSFSMVDSDTFVIYGGQSWSNAPTFYNDIWSYSISSNTWTQLNGIFPDTSTGNRTSGLGFGCNGKFYVFGGQPTGNSCANNFWVYHLRKKNMAHC